MLFFGRTVVDDFLFLGRKVAKRHVRSHAHGAANVGHQRPHQRVPGRDGSLVDGKAFVGHERTLVDLANDARTRTRRARSRRVERKVLGARRIEQRAALGADQLFAGCDGERRRHEVTVRADVARKPRVHQPEAVAEFRKRAESTADVRHRGALVKRERGRHVLYLVHVGGFGLGEPAARVRGQRFEVAARALGVQHAQRERRLAAPRHAGYRHEFSERYVYVYIFKVMHARAAHYDFFGHFVAPISVLPYSVSSGKRFFSS